MIKGKLIDSHRHFTLDVSNTDDLIRELDADGIEKTVLFGYHGFRYSSPHAQDTHVEKTHKNHPQRIIPFLCDLDFGDSHLLEYVEEKLKRGVFRGVGEILIGHKPIKETYFSDIDFTDSVVIELFRLIGDCNAPVLVHVDPPYQNDFEMILDSCQETKFICAHIAYDFLSEFGGKERDVGEVERLLAKYPHLYFDISHWKISPIYLLSESWRRCLEKHSERFVFGTDMTDHYTDQSVWIPAYRRILDSLNPSCTKDIGRENILRICDVHISR